LVAVETIDTEYPSRSEVARIHREGLIAKKLSPVRGVRQVYSIQSYGSGNLALICEYFDDSIRQQLDKALGQGLPVETVLAVACGIAEALGGIHDHDIVHKALSPSHVLLDSTSKKVALSGFGIASELDQERQAMQLSRELEGPLPYMSPEQTGRMNRDLDYRSDFYSLGILMFEMLTGQLPFKSDDILEWVHGHISQIPPLLHEFNPLIPPGVSNLVLKLMAKSPEDRYQSAEGLIQDLAHCINEYSAQKEVTSFVLAKKENIKKFLIPQRLYGRDSELQKLFSLFELAIDGHTEFCLIQGYSGVGKSALVNELDSPLVRERGFLIQGKFEQFQKNEAYSALLMAFRGLIHQVLAESEERLNRWSEKLKEALAPNASLMIERIPELEMVIGKQPIVAELPPNEERNRLQIVLISFLRVFASKKHPLVLFLDDLQWSDVPTLELLDRLATSRELTHLLIICAYRSNEIVAGHPLRQQLEAIKSRNRVKQIHIGPLDKNSVTELTADALCRETNEISPLSKMLFHKAQGNPFFTNELLRQLHREGEIYLSQSGNKWSWTLDDTAWSSVSDDVVEFMVGRLRDLQPETQKVLQLAACIGASFDLKTLANIYQRTVDETASALLPALKQYSIIPLHTDYRLYGENIDMTPIELSYKFQHDRVQQAAYGLINPEKLPEMHLSIGRLMLEHTDDHVPEERLIDIVNHFNLGSHLISSDDERLEVCRLNLRAGVRARHSAAYEAAFNYLTNAGNLLPEEPWEAEPELFKKLAYEAQQCAYLTGRSSDADVWIKVMLDYAKSNLEKAHILSIRTRQYATLGRMDESILSAIEGLAILGIEFHQNPTLEQIEEERALVIKNLNGRAIADLVKAPDIKSEKTLTAIRLLMEIFAAAFLSGTGNLFSYQVLKAVNLVLKNGNCPEAAFSYAAYGMLLCGEFDEPALGYEYGKVGLAINEHFDDITLRARVIYVYAMFIHHWSNDWASLTSWFRKGIEAGYQSGDLLYLAYSAQDCVIWDPTLDLEIAQQLHMENLEIVRECAYQDSLDSGTLFLQLQRNLQGDTLAPNSLSSDDFNQSKCLSGMRERQFMTGIANYNIYHAEIGLLYGDYFHALKHIQAQDQLIKSSMALPQLVRFYIVAFLTLSVHYPKMTAKNQEATLERLNKDLARMTRLADNCEANFRHLQYLMQAELARIEKNQNSILARYDQAIDMAKKHGFLRDEAMACERAARYLLETGQRRSAEGYLRAASLLYGRWGALRKVQHLEQEFPVLRELTSIKRQQEDNSISSLDIASVMKASRKISGEIILDQLLETTLKMVMENAGGQWGYLIYKQNGKMKLGSAVLPEGGLSNIDMPKESLIIDSDDQLNPVPMMLISHVLHTDEPIVLTNAAQDQLFQNDPYVKKFQPVSVICVPINRERFDGVIYLENNLLSGVFTKERIEIIKLLTAQASVAIENARLYEEVQDYSLTLQDKVDERTAKLQQLNYELQSQVDRDGLTGVANRRCGDAYIAKLWESQKKAQKPLTIVMTDVDHFKAYNDNYGHQLGDDCLIMVAKTIQEQLPHPSDMIARFGGEEFILILPNRDEESARAIVENICQSVEMMAIEHMGSEDYGVVTISAGISSLIPSDELDMQDLVRAADVALYSAKRQGRNRFCSRHVTDMGDDSHE